MISVVIPTLNRAYTLRITLSSYFEQDYVTEVIVVDDGGHDDTHAVVQEFNKKYPNVCTKYIKHSKRLGAAAARNTGVNAATNAYVLFGDDDAFPGDGYVFSLFNKLKANHNVAGAAGRWVQMLPKETQKEAKQRFGKGWKDRSPFDKYTLMLNAEAYFEKDQLLPLAPPVLLTSTKLLLQYPFDEKYCGGNGYREETTFQVSAYNNGYDFLLTNDVHCYHLSKEHVTQGGQRMSSLLHDYRWRLYFNHLFLKQYYSGYKKRMNLTLPKFGAEMLFAASQCYLTVMKPLGSTWIKKPIKRFFKTG